MKKGERGRDLFIQGGCGPGQLSISVDGIKEVYTVAVEARTAGQKVIPVHIFPRRLTPEGLEALKKAAGRDKKLAARWDNLKEGYDWFEERHQPPAITIDERGMYLFADPAAAPAAAAEPAAR